MNMECHENRVEHTDERVTEPAMSIKSGSSMKTLHRDLSEQRTSLPIMVVYINISSIFFCVGDTLIFFIDFY